MPTGASLTIATDWEQYALEITSIMDASSAFILKEDAAIVFPRGKVEVATLDKQNLRREASVLDLVSGISHTRKQRRSRVRRRFEGSSQDTYSLIPSSYTVQFHQALISKFFPFTSYVFKERPVFSSKVDQSTPS